jgi:HK97 family phage portal protein
MNIRNLFKKKPQHDVEQRSIFGDSLMYGTASYSQNKAMHLSTVYRCVEVISDSIAQLPLEVIQTKNNHKHKYVKHAAYKLLAKEPNQNMSRYTFIKLMVTSMLLKGNAYAYIVRDERYNAKAIYYVPSEYVTIIKPTRIGEPIRYSVTGIKGEVEACNMIHILNFTYDGFEGISTIRSAATTLGIAMASENHSLGFFNGGCNTGGILKVNTPLNQKQKDALKSSWIQAFNTDHGTPNGVAILEGNMEYSPITVNPADAQLLESRQFNTIEICRFFGVNPVKVFDLSKSSYSTVEATNLSFLTDTLSPIIEKITLEFERKIFKPSERDSIEVRFDLTKFMAIDKQSEAAYFTQLFNIGAITVNEIRQKLDLCPVEGGNVHFVQCNLANLSFAANQVNSNQVDNKVTMIADDKVIHGDSTTDVEEEPIVESGEKN